MFFNKKEKEVNDQFSSYKNRQAPRYDTEASILVEGFEGEGLLKNICLPGCCLESVTYISVNPSEQYKIKIIPEPLSNIGPIEVTAEISWVKSTELAFEAGLSLINPATDKSSAIQRYVEFLRLHNRQSI